MVIKTTLFISHIQCYTFSLYGHIGLPQELEPLTLGHKFQNLGRGLQRHYFFTILQHWPPRSEPLQQAS